MTRLFDALRNLSEALGAPVDAARKGVIEAKLRDHDLADEAAQPAWLVAMLESLAARRHTPDWVPFEVKGLEMSDAFDLVRGLDQLVPVRVVDDAERWTIVAEPLGHEAILAFEGYLWLTKPIDAPEPAAG